MFQFYFEIEIDLFCEAGIWLPNPRVRTFATDCEQGQCTCEQIIKNQLQSGAWRQKFSQKVLCLSPVSLGKVFSLLHQEQHSRGCDCSTGNARQRRISSGGGHDENNELHQHIMFDLKQLCECDRLYQAKKNGALDAALLDPALVPEKGLAKKSPGKTLMHMNFDGVMRPTPLVLHLAGLKTNQQLQQKVNREVHKAITSKRKGPYVDDHSGFVYLMQWDAMPGHIKIGFSKKNTAIRNDAWQPCFQGVRVTAHTNSVQYAGRIEKLVHAELTYFRRWLDCSACGKQHTEWFEIDVDVAKRMILRWSRWLASSPYQRSDGELKPAWAEKFSDKKCDNLVVAINKYVKPLMRKGTLTVQNPDDMTEQDRLKQRVQAVKLITVDMEVS